MLGFKAPARFDELAAAVPRPTIELSGVFELLAALAADVKIAGGGAREARVEWENLRLG